MVWGRWACQTREACRTNFLAVERHTVFLQRSRDRKHPPQLTFSLQQWTKGAEKMFNASVL